MNRDTEKVDAGQEVPTVEPIQVGEFIIGVIVTGFEHSTKPGSSFKGNATIAVSGVIPGHVLHLAKIGYFSASDPQNPEEHGRATFARYKNDYKDTSEEWKNHMWITGATAEDRALHYKILGQARKAIEIYLKQHESPTASFDQLPQDVPVDDSDIPF